MREFIEDIAKRVLDQPDGVVIEAETLKEKLVPKLIVAHRAA